MREVVAPNPHFTNSLTRRLQVVLAAVATNRDALNHADEGLLEDAPFMLQACQVNKYVVDLMNKDQRFHNLRQNQEFMAAAQALIWI